MPTEQADADRHRELTSTTRITPRTTGVPARTGALSCSASQLREAINVTLDKILREEPPSADGSALSPSPTPPSAPPTDDDVLPARMVNEFVYCPRLFYYEHVEGVFVHNADTLRGAAQHRRVDNGTGRLPAARRKAMADAGAPSHDTASGESSVAAHDALDAGDDGGKVAEPEILHSRSVQLGSDRLKVVCKMDLIESTTGVDDLFAPRVVTPVEYKSGAPRDDGDGPVLWDADRIQLALQCFVLRDNGYSCNEGILFYRQTRQRVRLVVDDELERWTLDVLDQARRTALGPIPPPLIDSPKCVRCSLAPVCLPDETRALREGPQTGAGEDDAQPSESTFENGRSVRRLMAPREDRRALYLNTPGLFVGRSENVLIVKDKKIEVQRIRINDVCHLGVFGNIQISTQTVQALCENDVPIAWFSGGGWFYGLTRAHSLANVFTRIAQFRFAAEPDACLALARRFVSGKIRNQRTMLRRNERERNDAVLLRLRQSAQTCLRAASIDELLGIEGAAASDYFSAFSGMLRDEDGALPEGFLFDFRTRNRRPPRDPVNALLSLAYSLLAKDCTVAAHAVGFDPSVGFYHRPRFGRPALALDIMEEFRPILADSAVITAINNRMLTESDFVCAGSSVNLTPAGRRTFFQVYETRMNDLVRHPVFGYQVCYRRAIELQFRMLARHLTGEIPHYIPFVTR